FSLFAREKAYINEVVLATAFGVLTGPLCMGIFDPQSWAHESNRVTLEVMRVVLATGLFAIGADLPKGYMHRHAKGLLAMVVPTMTIGWFVVAGLLKVIFHRFDYITCLVLAACLTPTDPIISASVVGGEFARKHVPSDIRHILLAESAANDGLAYPFLSISFYLVLEPDLRTVFQNWLIIGWFYEVILGTFIGAIIGYLFSRLMQFSRKRAFINHESYMVQCLALAIFAMGVVNIMGSDDLLASFAAGYTFSLDGGFDDQLEDESISATYTSAFVSAFASVIDYILNCGCFFYIGAWLPWEKFTSTDLGINPWRLLVLCIGILILRRIPAMLVLYRWVPEIKDKKEALFCGHFGPMGVGAIFISTLAKYRLPEPASPPETPQDILATALHPVVGFVVLVSIIVHGLSIAFFTASKRVRKQTRQSTNDFRAHIRDGSALESLSISRGRSTPAATPQFGSVKRKAIPELIPSTPNLSSPIGLLGDAEAESSTSNTPLVGLSEGRDDDTIVRDNYGPMDEAVGRLSMEIMTTRQSIIEAQ
ncbi:hypothetical protein AGABI2DRAFT_68765, partial [Agaricus bisporus var. bisporus H97]|uniref:hypothetical protein n=1 Tax=Agaricus bisporus var. bisporus (strain H97 / ATCC MYA-4626 / FGSC 10389) TaxID=936046 RepID=UPI00029F58B3